MKAMKASGIADRITCGSRSQLWRCLIYAVCGAVFALPLLCGALWPLSWISFAPVAFLEATVRDRKKSALSAWLRGLCFFYPYGLITFHWFWSLYPFDFFGFSRGAALSVALLASLGLPLVQSITQALIFSLFVPLRRRKFTSRHPFLSCLYVSGLWVVFEWILTLGPTGVPWGRLALTQTSFLPALQSASLLGCYFVSFLIVFVNCTLAASAASIKSSKKKSRLLALIAAAVFIANLVFGAIRISAINSIVNNGDAVSVAAIQGNIGFEDKWSNELTHTLETYKNLSVCASHSGAQLILWPETAVPYDISDDEAILPYLRETAQACQAELLCGVFQSEDGNLYNTIHHILPDISRDKTVYKKQHLVPFGEYVPGEDLIDLLCPPLARLSAIDYPVSRGKGSAVFSTKYGKVCSLICFDSIYGETARRSVKDGGELICISTNDSWFDGSAALSQHNSHAVLRAVECGRYVLRAANTGISSIIAPSGKIIKTLDNGVTDFLCGDVVFIDSITPYVALGSIIIPLCAVGCFTVLLSASFGKKSDGKDK